MIPAAFFKIVGFMGKETQQPDVRSSILYQDREFVDVDHADEQVSEGRSRGFMRDAEVEAYIAAAMVRPNDNERDGEWVSVLNLSGDKLDLAGGPLSDTGR